MSLTNFCNKVISKLFTKNKFFLKSPRMMIFSSKNFLSEIIKLSPKSKANKIFIPKSFLTASTFKEFCDNLKFFQCVPSFSEQKKNFTRVERENYVSEKETNLNGQIFVNKNKFLLFMTQVKRINNKKKAKYEAALQNVKKSIECVPKINT